MTTRSDEELLSSIARDPDAFEELYRRHLSKVMGFAARRCDTPEEMADLVSAVFLQAIRSAQRFDAGLGSAVPWLLGIAAHEHSTDRRRLRRERGTIERLKGRNLLDPDDHERLEARIDAARLAPRVRQALGQLPAAEREMVELTALEGLTPAQAARALRIRPATARMRLNRGRKKLRRALGAPDGQPGAGPVRQFSGVVAREEGSHA